MIKKPCMKLGLYLRNMGPQSTVDTLVECTRGAEAAGIDDLWVADHIANRTVRLSASGAAPPTKMIHASRYTDVTDFVTAADLLTKSVRPALTS